MSDKQLNHSDDAATPASEAKTNETSHAAASASGTTKKASAKHSERKSTTQPYRGLRARIPWTVAIGLAVFLAIAYQLNEKIDDQSFDRREQIEALKKQLATQQETTAQKLELQQQALRQVSAELERVQTQLSNEQAKSAQERLDLEAKIKQVENETAAKGKDPLNWRVAEVDYLMALANHRLQLTGDVDTARTALLDADKRLRQIADPGLNGVRMALADEIKSLDGVEQPDIAGMANQLSALVGGIEQLPLSNREHQREPMPAQADDNVSSWRELPGKLLAEIRSLVVIRRHDHPIEPLLPPPEKHYLAQNLGLKLEQARLALLRRDDAVFHANIADTQSWVERYFDKQEATVQSALDNLTAMQLAKLRPELPDISKSLRELRAWRQAKTSS